MNSSNAGGILRRAGIAEARAVVRCSPVSIEQILSFASQSDRTAVVRLPLDTIPSRIANVVTETIERARSDPHHAESEFEDLELSPALVLARTRVELRSIGREILAGIARASGREQEVVLAIVFPRLPTGSLDVCVEDEAR